MITIRKWCFLNVAYSSLLEVVAAPSRETSRQHVVSALRDIFNQAKNELDTDAIEALLLAFARFNDEPRVSLLLKHLATLGERFFIVC